MFNEPVIFVVLKFVLPVTVKFLDTEVKPSKFMTPLEVAG